MKKIVFISALILGFLSSYSQEIIHLDEASFKEKVWNFDKNTSWKFEGNVPVIVDFYADWCKPCSMIAPYLVELQKEYGNKIQVYKVDVDKITKVAQKFDIRSIPTLLFIPTSGAYTKIVGYRTKEELKTEITSKLKVK